MKTQNFSDMGFIRLPQVLSLIPISKSAWWQGIKDGRFPKPQKLGPRTSAWRVNEIKSLIENFPADSSDQVSL